MKRKGVEAMLPMDEAGWRQLAAELGVSTIPGADASGAGDILLPALQRRVLEALNVRTAERALRQSMIATVVSVISTIVAIAATVTPFLR